MKENYFFERGIYYRINKFKLDRPFLLYIHGMMGSSSAWLPFEKYFQEQVNLVTIDLRGHGKSNKYPNYEDYHIRNFAIDIEKLIQYLGIEKCILVGHSFGAFILLECIRLFRKKIAGLVFLSPHFNIKRSWKSKI